MKNVLVRMFKYHGEPFIDKEMPAQYEEEQFGWRSGEWVLTPIPKDGWAFRRVIGPGPEWHGFQEPSH